MRSFVIVIAGPAGTGKTTLSRVLSKHYDCDHISEDELTKEIFPDSYINIEDYPDKSKEVARQLLKRMTEVFDGKKCVVVDRINLDRSFVEEIRKLYHRHLIIRILWPPIETAIERDMKRDCWTSGENTIRLSYQRYEELKLTIGEENYIDNSIQTPEETVEKVIAAIEHAANEDH